MNNEELKKIAGFLLSTPADAKTLILSRYSVEEVEAIEAMISNEHLQEELQATSIEDELNTVIFDYESEVTPPTLFVKNRRCPLYAPRWCSYIHR